MPPPVVRRRSPWRAAWRRCRGRTIPGLASLPSDQRVLRTFDLGAVAFRALAQERGLAILIDDVQWADDDSLRLLRYAVRADAANPILLLFAVRPEEFAFVTEAVNLIADMDRMGVVRRLKVNRFTPAETGAFLGQVLGGPVDPKGASVMHAQAEGVPFMVEEMAFAYREAGMIQQIDGTWTLARNAGAAWCPRPSRRSSRDAPRACPRRPPCVLAEAAVLGRPFRPEGPARDRDGGARRRRRPRRADGGARAGGGRRAPGRARGGLARRLQLPARAGAGVRDGDTAAGAAPRDPRRDREPPALRRAGPGEPPAAGPSREGRRATLRSASGSRWRPAATRWMRTRPRRSFGSSTSRCRSRATPQERVDLLEARDRALEMLRRPDDRMQGLAELAALSEAMADSHLELDVRLRRAAAMRMNEEEDRAAQLAREVVELAASRGDRRERARGVHRARPGSAAEHRRRDVRPRSPGGRSGRRRTGLRARARDRPRARRRRGHGAGAARARRDRARPHARLVHQRDRGRRDPPVRDARRGRGGPRRHHAGAADRVVRRGGYRLVRGGARDLRADRRPSRRDVHDHRDGVPELGAGHPHGYQRRPQHRGDPAAHVSHDGLDHRERPRLGRGTDAVQRPRVRAREGDPRPRDLARRGGLPRGERARRSGPVVPGGRRHGDGVPRPGRAERPRDVARLRGGDRLGEPHAAAGPPVGDLARRRVGGAGDADGMRATWSGPWIWRQTTDDLRRAAR